MNAQIFNSWNCHFKQKAIKQAFHYCYGSITRYIYCRVLKRGSYLKHDCYDLNLGCTTTNTGCDSVDCRVVIKLRLIQNVPKLPYSTNYREFPYWNNIITLSLLLDWGAWNSFSWIVKKGCLDNNSDMMKYFKHVYEEVKLTFVWVPWFPLVPW